MVIVQFFEPQMESIERVMEFLKEKFPAITSLNYIINQKKNETFFDQELGTPFENLHGSGAVPTAQIETRFTAPSRHGDQLVLALAITKVGRTSARYQVIASCADQRRFETTATLVNVDASGKPTPWPNELATMLRDFREETNDT